jgi:hypothetical protein
MESDSYPDGRNIPEADDTVSGLQHRDCHVHHAQWMVTLPHVTTHHHIRIANGLHLHHVTPPHTRDTSSHQHHTTDICVTLSSHPSHQPHTHALKHFHLQLPNHHHTTTSGVLSYLAWI